MELNMPIDVFLVASTLAGHCSNQLLAVLCPYIETAGWGYLFNFLLNPASNFTLYPLA